MPIAGDDEESDADVEHLGQVVAREHAVFRDRRRVAANLDRQRPGHGPAAERRHLAGGRLDRLAVLAQRARP